MSIHIDENLALIEMFGFVGGSVSAIRTELVTSSRISLNVTGYRTATVRKQLLTLKNGKMSGLKTNNSFPFNKAFPQNRETSRFSRDCKAAAELC